MITSDEQWMHYALREAETAAEAGEIPVGAVIVNSGKIVGRGHNSVEKLQDPTAHAEMIALTAAADTLSSKWLQDCTLYVTLEPCSMCAGALILARIQRLVYGAADPKAGACGSVMQIAAHDRLNHRIEIIPGIREKQCSGILTAFFQQLRHNKKNT